MTDAELEIHRTLEYLRYAGRAHIKHRRTQPKRSRIEHAQGKLAERRRKLDAL